MERALHLDIALRANQWLTEHPALIQPAVYYYRLYYVVIIAEHDILGGHASREIGSGQNLYSAMPSMHVGWSLWCAYAVWYALRTSHPRLALLSWIFPLGMAAVVLITGNHYVLDIAGSAVLLVVAVAAVSAWGHLAERRRARD